MKKYLNIASYIMTMDTTIQISNELIEKLRNMKVHEKESYESIIWDLIEDRLEFSLTTKENISKSLKDIAENKIITLEQMKHKRGK